MASKPHNCFSSPNSQLHNQLFWNKENCCESNQALKLHMVLCKLLWRPTLRMYTVASFETISLMSFARSSNGCETKQMTVSVNQILLSCHPQPLRYNSDIKVCIKLGFLQGQIFRVAAKIWNVIPKLCAWLSFSGSHFISASEGCLPEKLDKNVS